MRKDDETDAEAEAERLSWAAQRHTRKMLAAVTSRLGGRLEDLRAKCSKSTDPAVRAAFRALEAEEEFAQMLFTGDVE